MKKSIIFTVILSAFQIGLNAEVENELKSSDKLSDSLLLMEKINQSLPKFMSVIKKYVNYDNTKFVEMTNDLAKEKSELSSKCNQNDIVSGRCPKMLSSDNLCQSDYVPALVHGNRVIIINNELIASAGLTSEKLRNMINSGAITCVPIEMSSPKPTQRTTTESPVLPTISSSSEDMNRMILLLLLNLLNQNTNKNGDTIPNACPTCSCKNCGSGSSSNSGTDNAFSQLANAIIGMEQLKFDLIKNKINADAHLLGSKLNVDLHLIKSKMGLQQALVNALLGSLNSLGSSQSSKTSQKDSTEQTNLNNRTNDKS